MSNLLYTLETVDAFVSENLALFRHPEEGKKRVHFFQVGLVELLYDADQDQHWIVALELTSGAKARMWPMRDLAEWKRIKEGR